MQQFEPLHCRQTSWVPTTWRRLSCGRRQWALLPQRWRGRRTPPIS